MNIRIYSSWKKMTNIWTNEYIRLNIFEHILISEYSSHTGLSFRDIEHLESRIFMIKQRKTWNWSSLKPSNGHRLVFLKQQNWSSLGHRFAIFQWIPNLGTLVINNIFFLISIFFFFIMARYSLNTTKYVLKCPKSGKKCQKFNKIPLGRG